MPPTAKTLLKVMLYGTAVGAVCFTSATFGALATTVGFIGYKILKATARG